MPFRDVFGHRPILGLLARSVARDSLPPSLIFAGPAGVGKRLTATALAQALNCLAPRDGLKTVPYTKPREGLKTVPITEPREGLKTVPNTGPREGLKTVPNTEPRDGLKTVPYTKLREGLKTVPNTEPRDGLKTVPNTEPRDGLKTVRYTESAAPADTSGPPDRVSVGDGLQTVLFTESIAPDDASVGNGLQTVPSATIDACGKCAACARIARGVHPDVLVLAPGDSGSIKIEQVRDVVDRAGYRPFEGKRRVVIIDGADGLVPAAQNALLKTLEEPPSLSVFILVTARPDVLLPTVRSRCPRLNFRPLSPIEIADALVARGQSETSARAIAATADGSLGRALEANGDDLVQAREVAQQVLKHAASTPDPRRRIEGAKGLLTNTGTGGASADREQLASHLRAMASLLRDIELLSTGAYVGALANADVSPTLDRLTSAYRGGRGIRAFAAVDRALVALERNAGVKIVADWLVLEL